MRTLYLLRHAKSDWSDAAAADIDRPLAARGRAAAPAVGAYMRAHGLAPSLVLCSPARRTRETWDLVAATLDAAPAVEFPDALYLASEVALLATARAAPDRHESVLLIGHNPGMQEFATSLSGAGKPKALRRVADKFPTGGLAVISFEAARWADVAPGRGRLERFVRPRDLR